MTRYIFITGGVVSSLGKGITAASLGALLKARGFTVRIKKLDPYLNIDPGTMSPYQHGEVFVTDDGAETDLDLGHYERFTERSSCREDNTTSGKIYQSILEKERKGEYLGGTVQVVPHVTNEIKKFILKENDKFDFVIIEIGGTVGDIEALPFFEATRQIKYELKQGHCIFIHLTLIPFIPTSGELKTKPTQHSVKELRSIGIQPDIIICRCDRKIPENEKEKIALFTNVNKNSIIEGIDVKSIYEIPIKYNEAGLDNEVLMALNVSPAPEPNIEKWTNIINIIKNPKKTTKITIVGKYTEMKDAYKSLEEAVIHGGIGNECKPIIDWVDAESTSSKDIEERLFETHGIIVPGGFGKRGIEGKISAIKYAREQQIPFLGICFGMQLAVIETARNLALLDDVSSTEFGECKTPIVSLMRTWEKEGKTEHRNENSNLGGTMRLGSYVTNIKKDTLAEKIYKNSSTEERHRHRYEIDISYEEILNNFSMIFSGTSPDGKLPEIMERTDHPWFLGVQFHPELKSRPFTPHQIFTSFIKASIEKGENRL